MRPSGSHDRTDNGLGVVAPGVMAQMKHGANEQCDRELREAYAGVEVKHFREWRGGSVQQREQAFCRRALETGEYDDMSMTAWVKMLEGLREEAFVMGEDE